MSWNSGIKFSAQNNDDKFLELLFGKPDVTYFMGNPEFPYWCTTIKQGIKTMFVTSTRKLSLVGNKTIPTPLMPSLEQLANKLVELAKYTESLEVQAIINIENKIVGVSLRGTESKEFVPSCWDDLVKYGNKFEFELTNRYGDESWQPYLRTWNMSSYDGIVHWSSGYPTLLTLETLANLATCEVSVSEYTEVKRLHNRLRWCYTYMCVNTIPEIKVLEKIKLTKLEQLVHNQLSEGDKSSWVTT